MAATYFAKIILVKEAVVMDTSKSSKQKPKFPWRAALIVLVPLALASMVVTALAVPPESPAAKTGAQLFSANCAVCHGANLQGIIGPALVGLPKSQDNPQFLTHIISDGVPGTPMPAWKQRGLSDAQIGDLVQFIMYENLIHKAPAQADPTVIMLEQVKLIGIVLALLLIAVFALAQFNTSWVKRKRARRAR